MRKSDRKWVKLNRLLQRAEQLSDEFRKTLEADPSLAAISTVMDASAHLKHALNALSIARDEADPRSEPGSDTEAFLPIHYVAAAIRGLPEPTPDAPPQVVEIQAGPTTAWPHQGRYRLTFVVNRSAFTGTATWYWVMESSERLDAPSQAPPGRE
jgi:hypothetical protein